MKAVKLNFNDDVALELFCTLFLASDHNSEDHSFRALHGILSMWSARAYHVYCPLDDQDIPMGICHGQVMDKTFFGHIYFTKDCRGKKAQQGFEHCVYMAKYEHGIERLITHILPENKPAKMFASLMGFEKVDETKYICDLKESA